MLEERVFVHKSDTLEYPEAPFAPSQRYPEFSGVEYMQKEELQPENTIYDYVREILIGLELDKENIGTPNWRPFKDMIEPGQHAVLKPNFVRGLHPLGTIGSEAMITHASLMRPIIDYVRLSTGGDCQVTICDVPLQSSDWEQIMKYSRTQELVDYYASHDITVDLLDLRREISHLNEEAVISKRDFADRDPRGYAAVDLGERSALMPVIKYYKRFMITDYDKGTVSEHHNKEKNEYCIGKTVLSADLFINMPKLKTHRKAGLTVASKNLIGINGDKRWIAHHREKSLRFGGDEFPRYHLKSWFEFRLFAYLKRHEPWGVWLATKIRKYHRLVFHYKRQIVAWVRNKPSLLQFVRRLRGTADTNGKKMNKSAAPKPTAETPSGIHWPEITYEQFLETYPDASRAVWAELNPRRSRPLEGSWYGNDTIWRTIADLNYAVYYADKEGVIQEEPQRNYFCLVDGIISGEREGPMEHTPKPVGVLMGGFHPTTIDFTSAWIMGFDWKKIPAIREILKHEKVNFAGLNEDTIDMRSNVDIANLNLNFYPTINWAYHIERSRD